MSKEITKVFVGGLLIDGSGGAPVEDSVVLIKGERIIGAGCREEVALPVDNVEFYDISGKSIMPGLIDAHTHITLGDNEFDYLRQTLSMKALKTAFSAGKTLEAGFTTIRDLGAENLVDLAVRDAINGGWAKGPRMLVSGYKIASTGAEFPLYPPEMLIRGREAMDSPDEVRKAARTLLAYGVDVIKIMATGRTFRETSSPHAYAITLEEASVAVAEAHNQEVMVSAHAHGSKGIKIALKAGVDTLEHGTMLDDEDVKFMAEKGVFLVTTLSYPKRVYELGTASGLPEHSIKRVLESRKRRLESFAKALHAGVPIAMGSDAGMPFVNHGDNAFELEQLVEAGMTSMQALVASTSTAAKALGLASSVGVIEKNKLADILIVNGNPLKDITLLQDKEQITAVLKEGAIVVNRGIKCEDENSVKK